MTLEQLIEELQQIAKSARTNASIEISADAGAFEFNSVEYDYGCSCVRLYISSTEEPDRRVILPAIIWD